MSQALTTINFHGNNLYLINHQDEPYTPMRPIVEGMGLDWRSQHRKLTENKERWAVVMLTMTVAGQAKEVVCMPVRKLPAFFASISVNKVRESLRATIILFQTECDDVLWKYWTGQQVQKQPTPSLPPSTITPEQQRTLHDIVAAKVEALPESERGQRAFAQIWSRFNRHFGIPRYAELPHSRMSEGVAYLMAMDVAPKALPAPVESNVRLSPEAAKGLAARYPHLADVFMKHAGQGLRDVELETTLTNMRSAAKMLKDRNEDLFMLVLNRMKKSGKFWHEHPSYAAVYQAHGGLQDLSYSLDKLIDSMEWSGRLATHIAESV